MKKTAKTSPKPALHIDERAARSLDLGEAYDDELDPLGMSAAEGARPPNRHEAAGAVRPPNDRAVRPPNDRAVRPPNDRAAAALRIG